MRYSIDSWVFEKNPNICFGIIVGKDLKNTPTSDIDSDTLKVSEEHLRNIITLDNIKTHPDMAIYRNALENVSINPNKFRNSVEAMCRRVIKGGSLPRINALVDLCNAISLKEVISLGAHDLADIKSDLEVRLSTDEDVFLPFGATEFETMPAGELVFTSGNEVQTRQWLWRQSELGKITESSSDIVFQLVGFDDDNHRSKLVNAMKAVEDLIINRFCGTYTSYLVDVDNPSIEI